jgi:hypothetical protein
MRTIERKFSLSLSLLFQRKIHAPKGTINFVLKNNKKTSLLRNPSVFLSNPGSDFLSGLQAGCNF